MKFRILVGQHIGLDMEGERKLAEFDQESKTLPKMDAEDRSNRLNRRITLVKSLSKTWKAGGSDDIIDTSTDLVKRFNGKGPGTRKFDYLQEVQSSSPLAWDPAKESLEQFKERVSKFQKTENVSAPATSNQVAQATPAHPSPFQGVNLDVMSNRDLQAFAAEQEIDLKGASKRDDILKVLKAVSLTGGAV